MNKFRLLHSGYSSLSQLICQFNIAFLNFADNYRYQTHERNIMEFYLFIPKHLIIQLTKLQIDILNLNTTFRHWKKIPITFEQGCTSHPRYALMTLRNDFFVFPRTCLKIYLGIPFTWCHCWLFYISGFYGINILEVEWAVVGTRRFYDWMGCMGPQMSETDGCLITTADNSFISLF